MQRNSKPITWRPRGVSDTLDASEAFPGAMALLTNLIPDPSTLGLWQCRPASFKKADFAASGFINPQQVSVIYSGLGNFVFGMISTSRNPGRDEPFMLNLGTGAFVPIADVMTVNTPFSQPQHGLWIPPTVDLVGSKLIFTHPGFDGSNGNYFGWIDISNLAAPVWHAGNLTGAVTFTSPPSYVAQFSGRAYYIANNPVQPAVVFSDSLNGTNVTNASQVLTFGDTLPLQALGPLPLSNQLGGIIQSLMVFKTANVFQVTGDAALSNLSVNALNIAVGTKAPNTICTTPKGLAFIAPDGLRVIDFNARISDPIGIDGKGIAVPFIYSVEPSRMCAACAGSLMRVSTQNGNASGAPDQEYWFDFARGIWSGPHTFPASQIAAVEGNFILAPVAVLGTLWQSDVVQSLTSTFNENGQQMMFDYRTAFLPDTEQMTENCITEMLALVATVAGYPDLTVEALNQSGTVIDTVSIRAYGTATIWGQFTWGPPAVWGGTSNALAPRILPWTKPIVFVRLQVDIQGQCNAAIRLGTLQARYQVLRYLSNIAAAVA